MFINIRSFAVRYATLISWAAVILSTFLTTAALGLYAVNLAQSSVPQADHVSPFNVVMALTFPPVGLLILRGRPQHTVGWIFLGIGIGQAISQFSLQYAFYTLQTHPGALPLGPAAYWAQDFFWFPSLCLFIFLLTVFPTGQNPTGRWRWLPRLTMLALILFLAARIIEPLTDPEPMRFYPPPPDVFGIGDFLFDTASELAIGCVLVAVMGLLRRLQRSQDVERQQLKWFTFAGLIFGLVFFVLSFLSAWPVFAPTVSRSPTYQAVLLLTRVLFPISVALLPAAVAVAILRYRLYGIDLILRRTLVYSTLSLLFALIYAAVLILAQALLSWLTGQARSELAIVASTLTIAAVFAPLRSRIQNGIDRRFYRRRYDVEKALLAYSTALRKEVDLETILVHTQQVIEETIQPADVSIQLIPIKRT